MKNEDCADHVLDAANFTGESEGPDGAPLVKDDLSPILAGSPRIVELSRRQREREADRAREVAASVSRSDRTKQKSLPFWGDACRALPNDTLRSNLFTARNRKMKRIDLKSSELYVIGDGKITYTGEELRQDDETVWLQLIHLAKSQPLGGTVEFTARSFLLAVGWPVKAESYSRLRKCLTRMQATSLQMVSKRAGDTAEAVRERGKALSMIPLFEWRDVHTGKALRRYRVQMAPQLVELFGARGYFTLLQWAQRLDLPPGLATWLHGYFASHAQPYPIKLATIKAAAGLTTSCDKHLRALAKKALSELVRVRFLAHWSVEKGDLIVVERVPVLPTSLWPSEVDQ